MDTDLSETQQWIARVCDEFKYLLIEKNKSYGNSFAEPIRIFAKDYPPDAQMLVRIDDKLNRLAKGQEYLDEDTCKDLIGYLILWYVLKRMGA
jgi:hypothetical protein